MNMNQALKGKVALVAGATRGAGRGIACMLGEAGATVYCSGRSTRGNPSPMQRPETIDETAELVTARGGRGIAVRTDHTNANDVGRLVARIEAEQERLEIVVNDLWGGGEQPRYGKRFWEIPPERGLAMLQNAIASHVLTSHRAIPLLLRAERGLIIDITDGDGFYHRGNFYYDLAKTAEIRMAFALAADLRKTNVTALALSPGFLRSEVVLETLGVTEENWRDGIAKRREFAESETPYFVGRAVAALAADPDVKRKAGRVYNSAALAREYGFRDVDGRQPDIWKFFAEQMPQLGFRGVDDGFYTYWESGLDALEEEFAAMEEVTRERA
jgi:NAD(P)-dependent dehydrogenase (short-subunit alcohol dehydrogenase family)